MPVEELAGWLRMDTNRPTFETVYLEVAHAIAKRSACVRKKVGTVITSTDHRKSLAIGYNGSASGLSNSCDWGETGNCGCLHSEENAAILCDAGWAVEKNVYVTHLPCVQCAKRLVNLGNVKKVVYTSETARNWGTEILHRAGISVSQVQRPGGR